MARGEASVGVLLALVVGIAVSACSDETPTEGQSPVAEQAVRPVLHKMTWIKTTDGITPELWLASREARRDLPIDAPQVADMARVLDVASRRFRDQERMIANRAVQLEDMLAEKGIAERAPRLIVTLSQIPGTQRAVESFAGISQHYYNLRIEGLGQGSAIDALKKQFGRSPTENDAQ